MRIYLAELGDQQLDVPVEQFAAVLDAQRDCRHVRAELADADIILFTQCAWLHDGDSCDWRLTRVAEHSLCRRHPEKVYVYDERDRPWLRFPGLYVSMPAGHFRPQWQIACPYFLYKSPVVDDLPADDTFLFTFVGSPSARCREAIYELHHPRGFVERVTGFRPWDPASLDFRARRQHFVEIMARSKFVLCPRGLGTSSYRLYETLAASRVPVILADAWVPPNGPRWEQFTIRWPEGKVAELPSYLESREVDVPELIRRGSEEFKRWFAPDRCLAVRLDELEHVVQARHEMRFPNGGYRDRAWIEVAYDTRVSRIPAAVNHRVRRALPSAVKRRLRGLKRSSGATPSSPGRARRPFIR